MTKQELIDYFGVSPSTINTNFPMFCKNQLKRGFLITREGIGAKANYTVERVEKQDVDKSLFSTRGSDTTELENEQWIECYFSKQYEVSNLGRVRNRRTKIIQKGTINSEGYHIVSIGNKNYRTHRVILQSWNPREDYQDLTVDHINGQRSDNRLENLRWVSSEDNTLAMLNHRAEFQKELTRLLKSHTYDEILEILSRIK